MPPRKKKAERVEIDDYRHGEKRLNNPEAGLAGFNGRFAERKTYAYDPHLDPRLEWAGKAEHVSFDVDVVPLHIHERVSSKAILRAARREDVQRELFADADLALDQRVDFYRHDVDWANRLILGDSLVVMNSLLERELMAGKVQMIYIDPPYGVSYNSNFQPSLASRDVHPSADDSLTREPEQIKAYRDTWTLGIHSYLTYLRDRLLLARELLADSGSVFVQINDENLHHVKELRDEVFGNKNSVSLIVFQTTLGFETTTIATLGDFLLWYGKDRTSLKVNKLQFKQDIRLGEGKGGWLLLPDGNYRGVTSKEVTGEEPLPKNARLYKPGDLASQGGAREPQPFEFEGKVYTPSTNSHWKANYPEGMNRLAHSGRVHVARNSIQYRRFADDFPYAEIGNIWTDTTTGSFTSPKVFVVQTNEKVIERCVVLTTSPGDLVLDPTCGSGTTAYCAEKWGRRWITCDTSRVALNLARQRLLTARYEYYKLANEALGPRGGFNYKEVPHVTLKSIAQNPTIDEIYDRYELELEPLRKQLGKLVHKRWEEWEVPRDAEKGWPAEAKKAHKEWWALRRKRQQAIDDEIARAAPRERLFDQAEVERGVVRVSGPFTVEGIPFVALAEDVAPLAADARADDLARRRGRGDGPVADVAGDHVATLVELLRRDGVTFPGGKTLEVPGIRAVKSAGFLHAEAEAPQNGGRQLVAFSFGPRYGPVTLGQVEDAVAEARKAGYGLLVFAGFGFEPEATTFLEKHPGYGALALAFANVCPDVLVGDLLKTTRGSQLFTVFGQPDVAVKPSRGDAWVAELKGVDIYDPNTGEVHAAPGRDVAAWFLDHDYDGRTFCICQAFFPGGGDNPWDKLARALRGVVDEEAFARMRGTKSAPFAAGEHRRAAVKVIDFRGNEVIRVVELI